MADLGVGPRHDLMVADNPLCCSKLSIYTRKETLLETLLICFPLYLKKKIEQPGRESACKEWAGTLPRLLEWPTD